MSFKKDITSPATCIYYFTSVHMRLSFDGLRALVPPLKIGDILVADNHDLTRRKIYKMLPGDKHAILYLKTSVQEKLHPLANGDGKLTVKNLTMLNQLLLQLDD